MHMGAVWTEIDTAARTLCMQRLLVGACKLFPRALDGQAN